MTRLGPYGDDLSVVKNWLLAVVLLGLLGLRGYLLLQTDPAAAAILAVIILLVALLSIAYRPIWNAKRNRFLAEMRGRASNVVLARAVVQASDAGLGRARSGGRTSVIIVGLPSALELWRVTPLWRQSPSLLRQLSWNSIALVSVQDMPVPLGTASQLVLRQNDGVTIPIQVVTWSWWAAMRTSPEPTASALEDLRLRATQASTSEREQVPLFGGPPVEPMVEDEP